MYCFTTGTLYGAYLTYDIAVSFPMIQILKMVEGRFSFEQNKLILKWYWNLKAVLEALSLWTCEFESA